jgi:hypothetical protein
VRRPLLWIIISSILVLVPWGWTDPADASGGPGRVVPMVFPLTSRVRADIVELRGLPAIGKWMYRTDGRKADWLGVKWKGKSLIEPINVILIDDLSRSAAEARKRLYDNFAAAGFTERKLHSSGYAGYIARTFYAQLPSEKYRAFSDGDAALPNNHGRIFGPCFHEGRFVFTAAFSREVAVPTAKVWHRYRSFKKAWDDFSRKLDKCSNYRIVGSADLDNAISENSESTTGDHDGMAVVLSLVK